MGYSKLADSTNKLMTFKTESGSVYSTTSDNRISRLAGKHPPTKLQGLDGSYQRYVSVDAEVGKRAFIRWPSGKATLTTLVTEIIMA